MFSIIIIIIINHIIMGIIISKISAIFIHVHIIFIIIIIIHIVKTISQFIENIFYFFSIFIIEFIFDYFKNLK